MRKKKVLRKLRRHPEAMKSMVSGKRFEAKNSICEF